ncbi:MAG: single-stranded-DNA-specific exonuclease RecJ [Chloroflexi bacterium]|nr:single-stranded-DNA-specific exonuclease RecJ [Chloroflexota bacterium]
MPPRLNRRWIIHEPVPTEIDQALGAYPPFFRQILFARGIEDEFQAQSFLHGQIEDDNPFKLKGMQEAVERIFWAADHGEKVVVYGDYDVDGVTATALLVGVLSRCGVDVKPYIPNRFEEGYGLNSEALETLASQEVRLVITVDCGIRSPREAELAEKLGIDLIISDHHHPGDEVPDAWSVICPKQEGDLYPDKNLSGVGLAYKIAQALARHRPSAGICADEWLDLVALGTVADVVPLKGENRSLVRRGLELIRRGGRPGIYSLARAAGLNISKICAGDIGFILGPRLNAAGRIDTADAALRLLMVSDRQVGGLLAQELDNHNMERQRLTREIQDKAVRQAESSGFKEILFAFDPSFNSGIVGLAASRLVDTFYRPAVVGTIEDEFTRASCRSIPEFHITKALDECAGLLVRHGGHALAAGFTVRNENIPALVEQLHSIAVRELSSLELRPSLRADLEIQLSDLRPEFLRYLDLLEPTGQDNPEAIFVSRDLRVNKVRQVGADGKHLKLAVSDGRITYDAIAFGQGDWAYSMPERIDLLYTFERNEYNGKVSLQLKVRDIKASGTPDD